MIFFTNSYKPVQIILSNIALFLSLSLAIVENREKYATLYPNTLHDVAHRVLYMFPAMLLMAREAATEY